MVMMLPMLPDTRTPNETVPLVRYSAPATPVKLLLDKTTLKLLPSMVRLGPTILLQLAILSFITNRFEYADARLGSAIQPFTVMAPCVVPPSGTSALLPSYTPVIMICVVLNPYA